MAPVGFLLVAVGFILYIYYDLKVKTSPSALALYHPPPWWDPGRAIRTRCK